MYQDIRGISSEIAAEWNGLHYTFPDGDLTLNVMQSSTSPPTGSSWNDRSWKIYTSSTCSLPPPW